MASKKLPYAKKERPEKQFSGLLFAVLFWKWRLRLNGMWKLFINVPLPFQSVPALFCSAAELWQGRLYSRYGSVWGTYFSICSILRIKAEGSA